MTIYIQITSLYTSVWDHWSSPFLHLILSSASSPCSLCSQPHAAPPRPPPATSASHSPRRSSSPAGLYPNNASPATNSPHVAPVSHPPPLLAGSRPHRPLPHLASSWPAAPPGDSAGPSSSGSSTSGASSSTPGRPNSIRYGIRWRADMEPPVTWGTGNLPSL